MALFGARWRVLRDIVTVSFFFFLITILVSAKRSIESEESDTNGSQSFSFLVNNPMKFLWGHSDYQHVWPELEFGWQISLGTLIGIFGAAFGSVGGVGGGGIFVPMLVLVIGFDTKSATAISKCMLTGAAISTVIFNWKLKHPTLDIPIIEYDLVLLMQPILMLGISIGVTLSVIFAGWMVTVLLIILFIGTSIKACFKGLETWKKESILKEVNSTTLAATCSGEGDYKYLPDSSLDGETQKEIRKLERTFLSFRHWKELGLLCFVWLAHLVIQIAKIHTASCSITYWILNVLQIPVSVGVFLYQAIGLHQGWRVISSKGEEGTHLPLQHLILASLCGLLAGTIGGLLGIGAGFVMGPLFLELGIPPQVASATATFGMTFSASISVVQYYLLNRFPVPYGQIQSAPLDRGDTLLLCWIKSVPFKVACFVWKTIRHRIPVKVELNRRNVLQDDSLDCIFCINAHENVDHLFVQCPFASLVWKKVYSWLEIQSREVVQLYTLHLWQL